MTDTVDRWLDWVQAQLPWMPSWAISAGLLALAVAVATVVHRIFFRTATRIEEITRRRAVGRG